MFVDSIPPNFSVGQKCYYYLAKQKSLQTPDICCVKVFSFVIEYMYIIQNNIESLKK